MSVDSLRKDFNLIEFDDYKKVKEQYEDSFIKKVHAVKIYEDALCVKTACIDTEEEKVRELLSTFHYPKKLELLLVSNSEFVEFVGKIIEPEKEFQDSKELSEEFDLNYISEESSVVNIINAICLEAIRKNASDIHLECESKSMKVRFRIDGVLLTVKTFKKDFFTFISSRIKVMAGLNIMEQRLAQDGRMSVVIDNKKLDFRVSIVPVANGESIVLRLFNKDSKIMELKELGYDEKQIDLFRQIINIPSGLILITGPTGSGKTTTLHSLINSMDKEQLKIITIEDPVERQIDGIQQIQVNETIGFTFDSILRRVLRQDPDVIMVGEIRDKITAELAIRSSLTGHKILATLHTNDSISSINRLVNLGIEPYLIANVLKFSIAQRLVRRTCVKCKGTGCDVCLNTGYKGRIAVCEILKIDETLSEMIVNNKSENEIKTYLIKKKMNFLKDDAQTKVLENYTSEEEIKREGII